MPATERELAHIFRQPLWRAAVVLVLLAVVVTAALGGFRKAGPRKGSELPLLAPGTVVDAGLFAISAGEGWTTDMAPGRSFPSTDEAFLVVPLQVTNQGDDDFGTSGKLQQDLFWLRPGPNGRPDPLAVDHFFRADGGGYGADLPPRLRVPLLAVWKLPAGAPTPPTIELGLVGRKFVERTALTTESAWNPSDPVAKWKVALEARPPTPKPGLGR